MHCEKKIEKVGNNFVTVSFFGDAKRENSSRHTPDSTKFPDIKFTLFLIQNKKKSFQQHKNLKLFGK